ATLEIRVFQNKKGKPWWSGVNVWPLGEGSPCEFPLVFDNCVDGINGPISIDAGIVTFTTTLQYAVITTPPPGSPTIHPYYSYRLFPADGDNPGVRPPEAELSIPAGYDFTVQEILTIIGSLSRTDDPKSIAADFFDTAKFYVDYVNV